MATKKKCPWQNHTDTNAYSNHVKLGKHMKLTKQNIANNAIAKRTEPNFLQPCAEQGNDLTHTHTQSHCVIGAVNGKVFETTMPTTILLYRGRSFVLGDFFCAYFDCMRPMGDIDQQLYCARAQNAEKMNRSETRNKYMNVQ